jgi:prophage tail gpP-like protein
MTIKPEETATILVQGGEKFDDWESVFIQHRWTEAWPIFRFTAAERDPIPDLWTKLQFKPGDMVAIRLGTVLAITGVILTRQTSYDANNHGVMLQGAGLSWYGARGSIITKDGNFDGMTFEEVAHKVIAPFGLKAEKVGKLNEIPFVKLQVETGETLWNFLERIARPKGIILGSDHHGNFLLIGEHSRPVTATLVEGHNILRCQCTIDRQQMFHEYRVRGQTAGGDNKQGRDASEQEATVKGKIERYSPLLTPSEQPVWSLAEIADRAKNEAVWHEGTEVKATITVQGWFRPGGGLWRTGDNVSVYSPMAMLNMVLKIETVTFTQDSSSGTLTQLDLVAPWLLKDVIDYNVGTPNAPAAPGEAKPNTQPPATPEATKPADPYPEEMART